jgi:hypothetical protein
MRGFKHKFKTDKTEQKHRGTQNAMDTNSKARRSQQHKTNSKSHCSLQRTLLQAEIQKNSEKQLFTHSDSKQDSKEISKVQVSANMKNQISTFKN